MSQTDEGVEELPNDEEEEELYEEEGEEEEEHWSIYDADTFISGPFHSDNSTIREDILQFQFSFGYDCRKYFNLTVADPDTLMFASGNLINFFDVSSKTISFRRSALGGGIGHIKANPNPEFNHVAIAENGKIPLIIIYEWPTLDINCVLKGGSTRIFSHLDFSPDGRLLVSQAGDPDYLITIWNWPKRRILLRTKSYVNDVYRVKFSPYVPGQLTSCGTAHIKFWKMATTFTGLKLKGELGRFGKTEFSDILGVLPMPDEKVVSGCSWGNILVWDAGLIKLEVFRTLRRKCHDGPIVQISYLDGELTTIGMDGHVKIWWYEKIDQADPPDDDRVIQIEPTYDFYTPGLMIMSLRKRYPDPNDSTYFVQDGNGGIWIIDLNTENTPQESIQLYKCHAGKVVDMAACPWGPYLASLGFDGRLYLYAYLEKKRIFEYSYPAKGCCMIWLSPKIAKNGDELVMGFDDGTLRLSILHLENSVDVNLFVIQNIKPHSKPITKISINPSNTILVSGGEDSTIFIFQLISENHVTLVPIGYINVPNIVTCLTWHFENDNEILVGCLHGEIVQVQVPYEPQNYTTVSYLLKLEIKENKFTTYKAQIRRNIKIKEIEARKAEKVAKKRKEMEKLKEENPGFDIDEEVFLADSESEEELEPLHIPEVPNRIIWMQSTKDDTIWLSMGGYDAGYIYEYKIDQKDPAPYRFKMVDDGDDIEISSYVYNYNKKYLIFAMQNGEIRVNKIKNDDFHDLSDYWCLAMHDNENGFVPNMCFSFDEKYFFTCGHDGNVFSYTFSPDDDDYIPEYMHFTSSKIIEFPVAIEDEANYDKLSIEEASLKKEQDRIDRLANEHKANLRQKLKKLYDRFQKVLIKNRKLLPSQIIPIEDLELDPRVTQHLDDKLEAELALVKRKLAFDVQKSEVRMQKLRNHFIDPLAYVPIIVKGLNSNVCVKMLRQRQIAPENGEMLKIIEEKMVESAIKGRVPVRPPPAPKAIIQKKAKDQRLEYFLMNVSPAMLEKTIGAKLSRLLRKYKERKLKWEKRRDEWEEFLAKKPVLGVNHPDDDIVLGEAKNTIGDYKLKSDKTYKASKEQRETTLKKYKELLTARVKQFNIRNDFNNQVYALRQRKIAIRKELLRLQEELKYIHEEISADNIREGPPVPDEDESEFPEKKLELKTSLDFPEANENETNQQSIEIVYPVLDRDNFEKDILPEGTKKGDKESVDISCLDFDALCNISKNEKKDTPWESDIRIRRHEKKLFDQNEIITEMETQIDDFNYDLEALSNERFKVQVEAKLMDIFVVTLHQELIVLKEFETLEDDLQDKVNRKITDVLDMRDIINDITVQITERQEEIGKLNEEITALGRNFLQIIQENKFFDFLKKVFKKKYKPPKTHTDDESSSESSSSSSSSESEDDAKSIDSRDFAIVKQDLNVCPKGCDPAVYQFTVDMRTKRYELEIKVKEEVKMIEMHKKDLEIQNKKIKMLEKVLKTSQEDLEKFQREKQEKLNEVRCTIIIHLDQLQHLRSDQTRSDIMETLVFSQTHLSKLYKRVEELQMETEQQILKHKTNIRHLTRMKTDCGYMTRKIKELKETIINNMLTKFGKIVDINEIDEALLKRTFGKDELADLEEVVLKRLIHDIKLTLMDIKGTYAAELNHWSDLIVQTQKELTAALRQNTARQELLAMMEREKVDLLQTIMSQEKKKNLLKNLEEISKHYRGEIEKLESIIAEQTQQLQDLKDEIKLLKSKGMLLRPKEIKKVEEEEIQQITTWEQFMDTGVEEEEEEDARKPFSTEIVIPMSLHEEEKKLATELLECMFDALNIQLSRKSTENLIKETLNSVIRGLSMTDLVNELVRNLPIEPDIIQRSIIETTAEQIYVIQQPEVSEEDIAAYSKELLEDIVDEVLLTKGEPTSVIAKMVNQLVDHLPYEFLKQLSSLEYIIQKLITSDLDLKLKETELYEMMKSQEAKHLLKEILEQVFTTGIDLLYLIKDS